MEVDCVLKRDIIINSTWEIESGCKDLKNAIKFSSASSYDLEDVVQAESCVNLRCPTPSIVPCKLFIKLDKGSKFTIKRVDIVSAARIVECYGACEEYLDTIQGEYMDDFEGCIVYSISSVLPSTQEVTLKFARLKNPDEMWLYGLLFTVEPITVPHLKLAGIDLSNVNGMLNESSRPISDRAEYFRKLLLQCGNSANSNGAIDPQVLVKMFEGEYLKPLGETSKSMSKCLMSLIPFVMNKSEQPSKSDDCLQTSRDLQFTNDESPEDSVNSQVPSNNILKNINNGFHLISNNNNSVEEYVKIMKDYVDKSIYEMEERVTKKLEQRLREVEFMQSSKLDSIMKLLQERK